MGSHNNPLRLHWQHFNISLMHQNLCGDQCIIFQSAISALTPRLGLPYVVRCPCCCWASPVGTPAAVLAPETPLNENEMFEIGLPIGTLAEPRRRGDPDSVGARAGPLYGLRGDVPGSVQTRGGGAQVNPFDVRNGYDFREGEADEEDFLERAGVLIPEMLLRGDAG